MNAHISFFPEWLQRLLASKPTNMAQPRCKCGRYCKHEKPDITGKLVADMSAAGLYVPPKFRADRAVIDSIAGRE